MTLYRNPSVWSRYRRILGVAGFAAVMTVVLYPICIRPLMNADDYKKLQAKNRTYYTKENVPPDVFKGENEESGRTK
uniref:Small integral membrane protein 20 n=1 Tax=Pogona vitticeps TaxID=103695 RepID=A0ABM5GHS6_9SAUR